MWRQICCILPSIDFCVVFVLSSFLISLFSTCNRLILNKIMLFWLIWRKSQIACNHELSVVMFVCSRHRWFCLWTGQPWLQVGSCSQHCLIQPTDLIRPISLSTLHSPYAKSNPNLEPPPILLKISGYCLEEWSGGDCRNYFTYSQPCVIQTPLIGDHGLFRHYPGHTLHWPPM